MQLGPTSRAWLGRWMVAGWILFLGGCGDDFVGGTESASGTGTGTTATDPSTTVETPTTTTPTSTDSGMTDGTMSASTTGTTTNPTTAPTTGDTTQGIDTDTDTSTGSTGDTSTGSTTDTDSSTTEDTTTGEQPRSRTVTQTVNAGNLVTSPNFRLVFTMGQPTQNQGTTDSPNFKLRGGLVGANGSPP